MTTTTTRSASVKEPGEAVNLKLALPVLAALLLLLFALVFNFHFLSTLPHIMFYASASDFPQKA